MVDLWRATHGREMRPLTSSSALIGETRREVEERRTAFEEMAEALFPAAIRASRVLPTANFRPLLEELRGVRG
jgi:hypothetical protein